MPRIKKDYCPFSSRMDKPTFERLNKFGNESGQSKTVAIERAINMYIDYYDAKMRKLSEVKL